MTDRQELPGPVDPLPRPHLLAYELACAETDAAFDELLRRHYGSTTLEQYGSKSCSRDLLKDFSRMMTSRHALFLTVVLAAQTAFSAVLTAAERPAAAAATIPNAEAAKVDDPKAGGKVLAALFAGATTDANEAERRKLPDLLSVADVRESLRLARADYEQAAAIADLPAAERRSRWADFEAGISKAGPAGSREQAMRAISAMFLPATAKVCEKVDEANVRRQLLLQAIKAKR